MKIAQLNALSAEELVRASESAVRSYGLLRNARNPLILIADDDPNVLPLVQMAVKRYNFRTESVNGGAEALERLRMRSYDLLILDLEMSDVHGFEVLRALRESPRGDRVPVLILTAHANDGALARSFGWGADEVVKKPFDLFELGVRVFRLLRPFPR